ncbi:MAG: polyprenyl synthetase family protein [Candidatus Marinimicrobia bacterium]|nr:polyprenyl synthetase family protein [Candidatus Neomarinimicrobiota bacterium]
MGFDQLISEYRDEINAQLLTVYNIGPESLVEPINYVLSGKGKRVRPILTLFTAESFGGTKSESMPAALAVEILHNFTLVHDDIMDEDNIRHGKPTVHHKWDVGTAILSGDAMLSLALKMIQKSPQFSEKLMTSFIDGLQAVCEGQAYDKEFESRDNVTLDEYIHMIDLKTGYLIGLSAELGAISVGANDDDVVKIREYGRLIGRAFQIQDDLLEIYSNSNNMGKSLESDLLLGKKTYLMIQAKESVASELSNALALAQENFPEGLKKVRTLLSDSGIHQEAQEKIKLTIKEADLLLSELNIDTNKLSFFSNLITNRGN